MNNLKKSCKKDVSKENRKDPIVQLGLFLDDNGIPISYQLFPGNNIDQTTLRPVLKKNIDKMNFDKVIIIANGGLNRNKNITHILKEQNGKQHTIKENSVCYWSKKHYDKEVKENKKFIDYLEDVINFLDKLKDKPKKIEKFLNKIEVDKSTGEIANTVAEPMLDMDKISEHTELMVYYTLLTSELDKSDKDIISKYHGLSRIEDFFRIIKVI